MSGIARAIVPGLPYHLTERGNRRDEHERKTELEPGGLAARFMSNKGKWMGVAHGFKQ
jgi:hypothetical protein